MKRIVKKFNLLVVLVLVASNAFAQNSDFLIRSSLSKNYNTWSGGITVGNIYLDGDLRSFGENDNYIEFGVGAFVTKQINPVFGLQAELVYGQIGGEKIALGRKVEEGSFFNVTANGLLYLNNIGVNSRKEKKLNVYLKFGIGLVSFESTNTNFADGNPIEQPRTNEIEIPLGLGVRYKLNQRFDIELASTMHSVFGDGFDGTNSTVSESDKFFYTNLGVVYKFGKKDESVVWTNPFDNMYDEIYTLKNEKQEQAENVATNDDVEAAKTDLKDYVDTEAKKLEDLIAKKKADAVAVVPTKEEDTPVSVDRTGLDSFIPSVFFALNSAELDFEATKKLAVVAKILKSDENTKLQIIGTADKNGSDEYNEALALKRAENVKKYLVEVFGVDANRLEVVSEGAGNHLAPNNDLVNRRVDFSIK